MAKLLRTFVRVANHSYLLYCFDAHRVLGTHTHSHTLICEVLHSRHGTEVTMALSACVFVLNVSACILNYSL